MLTLLLTFLWWWDIIKVSDDISFEEITINIYMLGETGGSRSQIFIAWSLNILIWIDWWLNMWLDRIRTVWIVLLLITIVIVSLIIVCWVVALVISVVITLIISLVLIVVISLIGVILLLPIVALIITIWIQFDNRISNKMVVRWNETYSNGFRPGLTVFRDWKLSSGWGPRQP